MLPATGHLWSKDIRRQGQVEGQQLLTWPLEGRGRITMDTRMRACDQVPVRMQGQQGSRRTSNVQASLLASDIPPVIMWLRPRHHGNPIPGPCALVSPHYMRGHTSTCPLNGSAWRSIDMNGQRPPTALSTAAAGAKVYPVMPLSPALYIRWILRYNSNIWYDNRLLRLRYSSTFLSYALASLHITAT